jgi:hypothetical protein
MILLNSASWVLGLQVWATGVPKAWAINHCVSSFHGSVLLLEYARIIQVEMRGKGNGDTETSQGNSLYSCLKQTKMSLFFLLHNWRIGGQNRSCLGWGVGTRGRNEEVGKGLGGWIWCMLCTHVCKLKNETCWNYSRNGEGGVGASSGPMPVWFGIWPYEKTPRNWGKSLRTRRPEK